MDELIVHGSLSNYINYVMNIPCLTQEEELKYAKEWCEDKNKDSARKIILAHLKLVVSVATKFIRYPLPQEDFIQEGNLGLVYALKRFNYKTGVRFSTYATFWIKSKICEYLTQNISIVKKITNKIHRKLYFNLKREIYKLGADLDNLTNNNLKQLSSTFNTDVKTISYARDCIFNYDKSLCDDDLEEKESLLVDDNTPEYLIMQEKTDSLLHKKLHEALKELNDRERDIITLRWLNEHPPTLYELGAKYNISYQRINQIEVRALQKLKEYLLKNNINIDFLINK